MWPFKKTPETPRFNVMHFECPRCGLDADLYVAPNGQVRESSRGPGMIYGVDRERPQDSDVYHRCDEMDPEATKLVKVRESAP
jgi:hypothetical protein